MEKIRCPSSFCNSKKIQVVNKKKKGFSVSKGVLGALLTGSYVGILFGIEEEAQYIYKCQKCGKEWTH